jgi:hypothetical protein
MLNAIARTLPIRRSEAVTSKMVSPRSKDVATAFEWLCDGAPPEDVRTVIEVRHRFELAPSVARMYAIDIVRAAAMQLRTRPSNLYTEEPTHAVA